MKNKFFCTLSIILIFITYTVSVKAQTISLNNYSWTNLPRTIEPVFKKDTFNIVGYGAIADGNTLNTGAINEAISDCNAKGGGVVLIPGGMWLTGPVEMKSNVNERFQPIPFSGRDF